VAGRLDGPVNPAGFAVTPYNKIPMDLYSFSLTPGGAGLLFMGDLELSHTHQAAAVMTRTRERIPLEPRIQ